MATSKSNFWSSPLTRSRITSDDVKMPEMLLGYFIGPFGALLSSGIFTSILQNYFTDVLKLDLGFLTTLQLISTVLIVAANLVVGQLIERTRALAGKARPWILLSALTLSVASVLMFVVPFEGAAKMVWIAVAYNLYYAVAYPIYNTANSTMIPVSTRDSKQRGALASFTNIAGLGVMGCGSMVFPMLVSFALRRISTSGSLPCWQWPFSAQSRSICSSFSPVSVSPRRAAVRMPPRRRLPRWVSSSRL